MVGTFWRKGKPNPAEKSWLRLSAGCAMLNICEQKGVGDKFNTEQFYTLSKLVTDPVPQVREQFLIYYMKTLMLSGGSEKATAELPHSMPDYMLVFAVPVLTHDPAHTDLEYHTTRGSVWFILEPLR